MEDDERLLPVFEDHTRGALVDNLATILRMLHGPTLGYRVDRYEHSLQSATRALRNGESVDLVVGAALHDIGDAFAPENHSAAAAALLAPYVDDRTTAFCAEYDQNCFDPGYDTPPIEEFVPLMREVFGRPSAIPGVAPLGDA